MCPHVDKNTGIRLVYGHSLFPTSVVMPKRLSSRTRWTQFAVGSAIVVGRVLRMSVGAGIHGR